jgi:hypothetical protein
VDSSGRLGSRRHVRGFCLVRRAKWHHSTTIGRTVDDGAILRAPRLRGSASGVRRLGKRAAGAVLDVLEVAGGSLTVSELAEALHQKRPRDLKRRIIARLEAAEVVECSGDVVSLASEWCEKLDRERKSAGEIDAERRERAHYDREREGYRNRYGNKPDISPSDGRLGRDRERWKNRNEASGAISELERVPESLSIQDLYALMNKPVRTSSGRGRLWQALREGGGCPG